MTSKKEIYQLARLCEIKGIKTVVFSPGSRNAPLVVALNAMSGIECICLVDERAAAFFALGIAQATRNTVAIVCTSGTAALNYAPAIAEAYYQELPLLVLTADRPVEWIDQADMQSIRQYKVFDNYIKKSFQLPQQTEKPDDLWFAERIVAEAINHTRLATMGPVHINVPFTEPLYEFEALEDLPAPKDIICFKTNNFIQEEDFKTLSEIWQESRKILIIVGLNNDKNLERALTKIENDERVIILTESCSNINCNAVFPAIDRLIDTLSDTEKADFKPDLVITLGGMIVSKKIKTYLRTYKPQYHWSFRVDNKHQDTFKQLSHIIPVNPIDFFEKISEKTTIANTSQSTHFQTFKAIELQKRNLQEEYLNKVNFCDFNVFRILINTQPSDSVIQWGNSTPVRYGNLFGIEDETILNFANRGVGGIDGAVSTASGYAFATPNKIVTHITGDLAFFYDSNAFWNKQLPKNLRIILINNSGGNIFRIIPGPEKTGHLENFFEHQHEQSAEKLCEAFKVKYTYADSAESLEEQISQFYDESWGTSLLEIKTDGVYSAQVLRAFFEYLRE